MEIALGDFHDSFSPGEAILRFARNAGDGVPYGFYFDLRRPNP